MRSDWLARLVRWICAFVCLVVAIFFGFVPGIPGVPFFIVALFLISPDVPAARRLAAKIMRKVRPMRRMIPKRWRHMPPRIRRRDPT